MRATSTIVVFSSLLLAASVAAGPNDKSDSKKKTPAATTGSAAKKPGTTSTSSTGASAGSAAPAAGGSTTASGSGSAAPADGGTPADGAAASGSGAGGTPPVAPSPDLAAVRPEDMPTAVRMRRLEQKTQALKERAWQLKSRVQMLREQMLGGGVGAQAVVAHANEMGASFRLIKLIYALDGTQVLVLTDDSAENLYKTESFDVFAGPISPGNHNLSVVATYRGNGYGVFKYLSKYTFTAKGNQEFIAGEGKITKVDCRGFEKGGPTMPLEKRAAIECKVTQVQPEKPGDKPGSAAPVKPGSASAPAAPSASDPASAPAAPSASGPASAPAAPSASGPASAPAAPSTTGSTPAPRTTPPPSGATPSGK